MKAWQCNVIGWLMMAHALIEPLMEYVSWNHMLVMIGLATVLWSQAHIIRRLDGEKG